MNPAKFFLQPIARIALALCFVGCVGCGQRAQDELRGTWVVQAQGGMVGEIRETWNIADGKIVKRSGPDGAWEEKWTYQLNASDPTQRPVRPTGGPKRIDLIRGAGSPRKGIYKVEQDVLTVCFPIHTKTERPKEFAEDSREHVLLVTLSKTSNQPSVDMNAPGAEEELKGGRDDQELAGTWVEEAPGRPDFTLDTWKFEAGQITPKRGGGLSYQVDVAQQPKAINIASINGTIRRGIYKIENDLLTLCISKLPSDSGGPDAQRPKEFVTKSNNVDLRTFRRKK